MDKTGVTGRWFILSPLKMLSVEVVSQVKAVNLQQSLRSATLCLVLGTAHRVITALGTKGFHTGV